MARIRTGADATAKAYAENTSGGGSGNDFIPYMRLQDDGDIVRFCFVTELDVETAKKAGTPHVVINAEFHRIQKTSSGGKTYYNFDLCDLDYDSEAGEMTGECSECSADNRRTSRFMTWIYVESFLHTFQNPDQSQPWQKVQMGRMELFRQPVNSYMVFADGFYMWQSLQGKIDMYGTMMDRQYMITRHGARNQRKVTRDLDALKQDPISAEIIAGAADLPSLEAIATREVETMDGKIASPSTDLRDAPAVKENVEIDGGSDDTVDIEDLPW